MSFAKYQGQHRISQIYLKQFGHNEADEWQLSVWYKGDNQTRNLLVENFTKETNVFDLPYGDINFRRNFENESSRKLESRYNTVINNIANQKRIDERTRGVLFHFVANLICRAIPHRTFFNQLLNDAETKDKFIEEITMLNKDELPKIKQALLLLEPQFHLNMLLETIMMHIVKVFYTFDCIVLKDYDNRGWATSDNPVILDTQQNYNWIIPIESEIYFPLSRDYLLFMFHKDSTIKENLLRNLASKKLHSIDENTHKQIWDKIFKNECRYIIFPTKIPDTSLE
jgi:hypothetical protein